jgi:hypothetical protein
MEPDASGVTRRSLVGGMAGALVAGSVPAQAADRRPELLLVGPGKPYPSITAAGERLIMKWNPFATPPSHDPIHMIISPGPPGYYDNDVDSYSRRWPNNNHGGWPPYHGGLLGPAVIEGEPGKPAPDLRCTGGGDGVLYYQKGAFITGNYDATFRRLNFSGFRRADGYGTYSAVRIDSDGNGAAQSGNFLFEDVRISGCDDGLLGGSRGQTVTLRRCEFTDNGDTAGRTHNIYIGDVDLLVVEDVLSTRAIIGHLLKSRAAKTIIRRTRLLTGDGSASACLDVPDCGVLDIDDLVCQKGPNADAGWVIHYGGENQDASGVPFHDPSSITIRNLTMIAPKALANHPGWPVLGFANQSGGATSGSGSHQVLPDASGVKVYGLTEKQAGLPDAEILSEPPVLDWRSPVCG